jgi:hypothetical protein
MAPDNFLLLLLIIVWIGLDVLAMVYLFRERRLTRAEMGVWCFMALFLPVVGPICVIAGRPGQARK